MSSKLVIEILIVIILVAVGGFFWLERGNDDIPSDWKTYNNEEFGFEFKHPPSLSLKVDMGDCSPPEPFCFPSFQIHLNEDGVELIVLRIDSVGYALISMDPLYDEEGNIILDSEVSIVNNPYGIKIYKHSTFKSWLNPVVIDTIRYAFNKSGVDYWVTKDSNFDHQYDLYIYNRVNNDYRAEELNPNLYQSEKLAEQIILTFKFTE